MTVNDLASSNAPEVVAGRQAAVELLSTLTHEEAWHVVICYLHDHADEVSAGPRFQVAMDLFADVEVG